MNAAKEANEPPTHTLGDRVAPWVIVLAPLLGFLHLHGHSAFGPDILILAALICVFGLGAGIALSRLPRGLIGTAISVAATTALILIWIDLQFPADNRFRMLGMIVIPIAFVLRRHGTTVLAVSAAAVAVSNLVTVPRDGVDRWENEPGRMAGPPAIVHLVLDEHAGFASLTDTPLAKETRRTLETLYLDAGFRIYPRAYSRYTATANSLPNALNFTTQDKFQGYFGGPTTEFPAPLTRNEYFERAQAQGYDVRVYQPGFVDFCAEEVGVGACTTVPLNSLFTIRYLQMPVLQQARFVLSYWLANESYLYQRLGREYEKLKLRLGIDTSAPPIQHATVGGSLELLRQLESDIAEAPSTRGKLYFAHLLAPHSPYFLDEQCGVLEQPLTADSPPPWDPREAYLHQTRCVDDLVTSMLERIERALGPDHVVVIHGDHGARHHYAAMLPDDFVPSGATLVDGYSTLFAVRGPQVESGIDPTLLALDQLLDQLSRSGFSSEGIVGAEPFVFADRVTDAPFGRIPLPMDWLEATP